MRTWCFRTVLGIGLAAGLAVLATPRSADAFIHEIIAALCRAGGEDVEPPGQSNPTSPAFTRALMATGFIESTEFIDNPSPADDKLIIHFDTSVPNAKYRSAGFDLEIEDGGGPGIDLVLNPLVVPNENFPAHAHCRNLR
ncbi:MAG: hypothetical protein ACRD3G_13775 [Vicinamibacterales bacterium]